MKVYGDDGRLFDSPAHEEDVLRMERAAPAMLAALKSVEGQLNYSWQVALKTQVQLAIAAAESRK